MFNKEANLNINIENIIRENDKLKKENNHLNDYNKQLLKHINVLKLLNNNYKNEIKELNIILCKIN